MSVFGVLRDPPPLGLSFESIFMDDSTYVIGSFDAYMNTSRDYATWFVESSTGPIIGNILVSGGRVLGGIVHAQVASRAEWRLCAEALQARVTKLETSAATREVHIQEKIARALAQERELWQRDREAYAIIVERERSQLQSELAMLHVYTIVLIGELRVTRIHVSPPPHILGRWPIIPPYKLEYLPAPLGLLGGWGSFAQTQGPSLDLGYILGTSSGAGPSTSSLVGDGDDDDDDDGNQYFRDDDS